MTDRDQASASDRVGGLVHATQSLSEAVSGLSFTDPVRYVYNPLEYAWDAHRTYLTRFGGQPGRVVLLGMNPGPFGMAQTGVPFGEITHVRDWLGIETAVGAPKREHPKRKVLGFAQPRSEVSGARLWGWAQARFGTPEAFFERFFIVNYCPLLFLADTGRNLTPDKVIARERGPLLERCDQFLREVVEVLEPERMLGIGTFTTKRALRALGELAEPLGVDRLLHPSPASPAANRGWARQFEADLRRVGLGDKLPSS